MTDARREEAAGRILVIDDDPPVANLLQKILQRLGYEVEQVHRFAAARPLLDEGHFDLVTLDIMMPGEDGFAALEWIGRHHPRVGVVMATAVEDMEAVVEAMRLGAYDYLLKPFDRELVGVQIARAMERQRLLAENRAYQAELEKKVAEQTRALRRTNERLERKVRQLEARDRLLHLQQQAPIGLDDSYPEILQTCAGALDVERAVLYRRRGEELVAVAALGLEEGGRLSSAGDLAQVRPLSLEDERAAVARAWRQRRPCQDEEGRVAVPLVRRQAVLAVMQVDGLSREQEDRDALWSLASEAALLLWTTQVGEDLRQGEVQIDQLLDME